MKDKVEIEIFKSNFDKSHMNGMEFTSVGYSGKTYGGGSPCISDDEVRISIERAEETIRKEGDIPIINWGKVKPLPTKNNLVMWCK